MSLPPTNPPCWSTASYGAMPDIQAPELVALRQHLDGCRGGRGRLFALQCLAESLGGFLAARFVTTLLALALVIGLAALVW